MGGRSGGQAPVRPQPPTPRPYGGGSAGGLRPVACPAAGGRPPIEGLGPREVPPLGAHVGERRHAVGQPRSVGPSAASTIASAPRNAASGSASACCSMYRSPSPVRRLAASRSPAKIARFTGDTPDDPPIPAAGVEGRAATGLTPSPSTIHSARINSLPGFGCLRFIGAFPPVPYEVDRSLRDSRTRGRGQAIGPNQAPPATAPAFNSPYAASAALSATKTYETSPLHRRASQPPPAAMRSRVMFATSGQRSRPAPCDAKVNARPSPRRP